VIDLHERASYTGEWVGFIVALDHLERVECGKAGEKADEFSETQIVTPELGFGLEGCG
jgi:hypothetical protein